MVTKNIEAGIKFLQSQQLRNGSFVSYSSTDPSNFVKSKQLHSIFPTALILLCLNQYKENPEIKNMKRKAASYLLKQKSEHWSFNYWERNSIEAKKLPYPDDLDDTFCTLAAIYEYNPKLLDGAAFAKIISLLTTLEMQEGGPYRTWLVPNDAPSVWLDCDLAVNSNIAYFLSLQDIDLPEITRLIEKAIKAKKIFSPYYNSELPIIYFLSRWYKGTYRKKLIVSLLKQKKKVINNPILNAFNILALLNFGVAPEEVNENIEELMAQQRHGRWKPFGIYIDPVIDGKKHYAGSEALTTAFCVLAISTYESLVKKKSSKKNTDKVSLMQERLYGSVIRTVTNKLIGVDYRLTREVNDIVNKISKGNNGRQIILLPYITAQSLEKREKPIAEELLIKLGCASLYGWIAYTLYDDFLDEEGDLKTLSIANISHRELTLLFYSKLGLDEEFKSLFIDIMDNIDKANSWEIKNCRINASAVLNPETITLPNYGKYKYLAMRSMGHALSSIAILYYLGYTKSTHEIQLLMKFFYHYIVAKQLNDDAHDFTEDLKKGHINAVSASILGAIQTEGIAMPKLYEDALKIIHEKFWKETVVLVSKDILKHIKYAKNAVISNSIISNKEPFLGILHEVESSAQKALDEHANVNKFLQNYK